MIPRWIDRAPEWCVVVALFLAGIELAVWLSR